MRHTFASFKTEIFNLIESNLFYTKDEFSIPEKVLKDEFDEYQDNIAQGNDLPDMMEMAYQRIEEQLSPAL